MNATDIRDQIVLRRLPHLLQKIVGVLGWESAIKFLQRNGGREMYVPITPNNSKFMHGLSYEQTQRLSAEFGGKNIKLPTLKTLLLAERNAQIVVEHKQGRSINSIALKYNISPRCVRNKVNVFGIMPQPKK